jgi:hypothetical protein
VTHGGARSPLGGLRDPRPCTNVPDATCSLLRVPLDRTRETPQTLDLRVAVAGPREAPAAVRRFVASPRG